MEAEEEKPEIDKEVYVGKVRYKMRKVLLSSLAIIFGGLIYIFWRSESLMMFSWFKELHIYSFVEYLRNVTQPCSNLFPRWFYYSLPNALWFFSGILLFHAIWDNKKYLHQRIFWLTVFVSLVLGSEASQFFAIIPGTFDIIDLLLIFLAWLMALAVINRDKNIIGGKEYERKLA
ncbi:MAG: hypothetical protein P9M02_02255 [Candidatus Susulua stagnicola]|nr:hypothetical protein [Candidatus Susulua stagnicola]